MDVGVIGLGRMGAPKVRRPMTAGHRCVVRDQQPQAVQALADDGTVASDSLHDLTARLENPHAVRPMVLAMAVDAALQELPPLLEADRVVLDGGNSCCDGGIRRNEALGGRGIRYLDAMTAPATRNRSSA